LLRGKLSDVCGLDLTAILDELLPVTEGGSSKNETPLFEINKILNQAEGVILNSPIYKEITEGFEIPDPMEGGKRKNPVQLIKEYDAKIAGLRSDLESARKDLNDNIRALADKIPNASDLDNLVKLQFEKLRTEAFDALLSEIPVADVITQINDTKKKANEFYEAEYKLLSEQFLDYKQKLQEYINDYRNEAIKEINDLPISLQAINGLSIDNYIRKVEAIYNRDLVTEGQVKLEALYATIAEATKIKVGAVVVHYLPPPLDKSTFAAKEYQWKLVPEPAGEPLLQFAAGANAKVVQLQKKLDDLNHFITQNIGSANKFEQDAAKELLKITGQYNKDLEAANKIAAKFQNEEIAELRKFLTQWRIEAQNVISASQVYPAAARDAVLKVQGFIEKTNAYVDFLKKTDPYFYYAAQQQMKKDIGDIELRFRSRYSNAYQTLKTQVDKHFYVYKNFADAYVAAIQNTLPGSAEYNDAKQKFITARNNANKQIKNIGANILKDLEDTAEYKEALEIYNRVNAAKDQIRDIENDLKKRLDNYKTILQQQAENYIKALDEKVNDYIVAREQDLIDAVGIDNILIIQDRINQAKNIYRLLTSIKQQELTYTWQTDKFRDVDLGVVAFKKFSNPNTTLKVDVKAVTYFSTGKFPPAIERVSVYSENRLSNFGISFFSSVTVSFSEICFIAGSDRSTHFDVKIKDVQFDGALSFVQAFQQWLQTMGKGLILQLHGDHVALGYSLPIPAIKTPGFNIFNLSLNFDLRIYFDKRPLRFGFSLARPESKFGIAVGIYAGFGFFGIVADPKHGIVEVDIALEAGVWAGLSIGPASGEAKLAFGFRFTKNEKGVRLEGYIVAEGRLSFWIVQISARIYLGIVSENSYVEGICIVTVSVKVGIISKSFSASYYKKIAGAKSNNSGTQQNVSALHSFAQSFTKPNFDPDVSIKNAAISKLIRPNPDNEYEEEAIENGPISKDNWQKFITIF
jgi:hypothetical protein